MKADYPYNHIEANDWEIDSTGKSYIVKSDRMVWHFDRKSGTLTSVSLDNQQVLKGNTELMMPPLKTGACATEHSLDIPFLNDKCKEWELKNIKADKSGDTVSVTITGKYSEASGNVVYIFTTDGHIQIKYRFISNIDINPRQWGLVLDFAGAFKNLEWSRKGIWTEYPDDHIGRTRGQAVPFKNGKYQKAVWNKEPENKWFLDENSLGSNDFRSTKENIYWATLTNNEGNGIVITGNGSTSVRSWVNDSDINMLITGFHTGGGDLFFSGYYKDERRPLKTGDEFSGVVNLYMIEKK